MVNLYKKVNQKRTNILIRNVKKETSKLCMSQGRNYIENEKIFWTEQ